MDGSRLLNAAVGLDLPLKELAKDVDSVSFCFSKVVCISVHKLPSYCPCLPYWPFIDSRNQSS